MKKFLAASVAIILISLCGTSALAVSTSASAAVLIEAESGDVIYEKDAHSRRGPASTTKIMTALVAAEHSSPDEIVTVDERAANVEGSSAYLYAGEKVTMETLMYALMLRSANDAAAAIAYHIAGGIDEFAAIMNEKAEELGLGDTHFSNPHGLDDEEHYTSAYDLSMIARAALENETVGKIVGTKKYSAKMDGGDATRVFVNHNRLLFTYDDIIGVKTGFTKKCGRTLVSAAEKDGVTMIAVTLDDGDDWRDHRAMLDLGLSLYERVTLCRAGDYITEINTKSGKATLTAPCELSVTLPRERGEIVVEEEYSALGGEVRFYLDGRKIGDVPLIPG
ncbi:MAG: D-alanyl-D-alanine carboxypeptidase [Clostridia bacterium]|nr:D-alanyl-D-alanine carboxypeptidase [Clostridia bacterium]